jgi:hypothetical protein
MPTRIMMAASKLANMTNLGGTEAGTTIQEELRNNQPILLMGAMMQKPKSIAR